MIGTQVGRYHIQDQLGKGGMGVVYKAHDPKLGRTVALKFLLHDHPGNEEAHQRFIHEARVTSALDHPNICTVHDIGESDEGHTFIAMAYYEGETLKSKMSAGPLPIGEATDIAVQVAKGLHQAHEKGIVHRDIKPANIFITERGLVKILDFGIAKMRESDLTKTGTTMGTVAYLSPEQAKGEEVDQRADIWSLGVIMYEMLTGNRPFSGTFHEAVLYQILNEEPEYLQKQREDISAKLESIVLRALKKDISLRHQNVSELEKDLLSVNQAALVLEAPEARLAVLPLEELSGDPEQAYFADGITEEIITNLAMIKALHVISRRSVMRYKHSDEPLSEIGRKLNVNYLVEGTIRQAGERVRITAQLIEAKTERHLWAHKYENNLTDILSVQGEIAQDIAQEIVGQLSPVEKERLTIKQVIDPQAYEYYLKGVQFRNIDGPDNWIKSIEVFQKAIGIEPTFAAPYAGLVKSYVLLGTFSGLISRREAEEKAKEALEKALELNPNLSEVQIAKGMFHHYFELNWKDAENAYKKAIALNPSSSAAHFQLGWLLLNLCQIEEGHEAMKRAFNYDPLSPIVHYGLSGSHMYLGQYDDSIREAQFSLELDAGTAYSYWSMGMSYLQLGEYDKVIETLENVTVISLMLMLVAVAYHRTGKTELLEQTLAELKKRYEDGQLDASYAMGWVHAWLENKEEAIYWLKIGYELKLGTCGWYKLDPGIYALLRNEPEYQDLLKKLNLE